MAKIFEFSKGKLIDQVSGSTLTNTGNTFVNTEKGLVVYSPTAIANITLSTPVSLDFGAGTFSVVLSFKKTSIDANALIVSESTTDFFYAIGTTFNIAADGNSYSFTSIDCPINTWEQIIITCTGGNTTVYSSRLGVSQTLPTTGIFNVLMLLSRTGGSAGFIGYMRDFIVYDNILTSQERDNLYKDFLNAQPKAESKHWNGIEAIRKPMALNQNGLVFATNCIPSAGGVLSDISGNGNNGVISGAISTMNGLSFDGVNDGIIMPVISQLDYTKTSSVCARFRTGGDVTTIQTIVANTINSSNRFLINMGNGVIKCAFYNGSIFTIGASSGTVEANKTYNLIYTYSATGSVGRLYLNGILQSGVMGTGSSGMTVAFSIGSNSSLGFPINGEINDCRIYNRVLTDQEAKDYHNSFNYPVYTEKLTYEGDGNMATEKIKGTGTYQVQTITSAEEDSILGIKKGDKYYKCTSSGTEAIGSNWASGTIEFEIKKADVSSSIFQFIANNTGDRTTATGYYMGLTSTEGITLTKYNAGSYTTLLSTANSYIAHNTRYGIKIERLSSAGVFKDIPTLQVSDCVNSNYTTFTNASRTGFSVISNGDSTHIAGTADEISLVNGTSYLVEFDLALNSGTAPTIGTRTSFGGSINSNTVTAINGKNSVIFTPISTAIGVLSFTNSSTATNYTVSNLRISTIYPAYTFAVFIKGGAFGKSYQLVSTTGGSGTNPVTDSTYTSSNFMVEDLDTLDSIRNIRMTNSVEV